MTTESSVQTLHLAKNEPIHVVTPLGVIRLERDREDSRKIRFTFPPIEGFKALKGNKPEVKTLPLVADKDGHLVAQFDMLVPVKDSDGNLCGVVSPKMFRLVEEKPTDLPRVSEESPEGGSNELQPVSEVRPDVRSDCLGESVQPETAPDLPGSDESVGGLNSILAESGTYSGPKDNLPAGEVLKEKVT